MVGAGLVPALITYFLLGRQACPYHHQSILTYFKIGFWDGLSPTEEGGFFLWNSVLVVRCLNIEQLTTNN
jgi:hypothetical protein